MFNFFKNKSSVFLILVITFSISLSSFSNIFTTFSGAVTDTPTVIAQTTSSSSSISSTIPIEIQITDFTTDLKAPTTVRTNSVDFVPATFRSASSTGIVTYTGVISGPAPTYNGSLPNFTSYSCKGGEYNGNIATDFWSVLLSNAVCNFYWSGTTSSSVSSLSISSSQNSSSVDSSSSDLSSSAVSSTSYAILPTCPVSINDSINYYGGGHISLQNNSPYISNNLSANIKLPDGVTVYALEKGYNFYQKGNNLNISFPEVGPYSEIATFYSTNYTGADYLSLTAINCNQITNPPVSSSATSSSVSVILSTQSSSSSSQSSSQDSVLPVCDDEVVIDVNSCICPEPREFVDASAEVDHYHICKIVENVTDSSSSSSSVSATKPPFCESPNLVLSADQKLCVCPIKGYVIIIERDSNDVEVSNCKIPAVEVATSSSSSTTSEIAPWTCLSPNLIVSSDRTKCICPTSGDLIYIIPNGEGKDESICAASDPRLTVAIVSSSQSSSSVSSNSSSISTSSSVSSSSLSSSSSSSTVQVAAAVVASTGGVINIGGIGGSGESSTTASSQIVTAPVRLSGQLSAREVPSSCEDSVKVNGACPSQGTLDARQVPDMFSIDDPYTCGGNLTGKVMNASSKTVKYEFFRNGSSTANFSYDVPVQADGTFELVIDYKTIPEDTYKIVYSATNNSGVVVSQSIEEFVTSNCTGTSALAYFANKTVRTGGQGLTPILLILFGVLSLVGAIKFALLKPRMN